MKRLLSSIAVLALVAAPVVRGQGPMPISIGVRASTFGFGGEVALGLTDRVEVRGVGNYFSLGRDMDLSDVDFDVDLKLKSAGGLVDLYAGPLRLTAGGMWNGNRLGGTATPTGTIDIGDTTYTASNIGTVAAGIDFKKFAPYLGIGLGGRGKVGFFFDLGVMFTGSPNITYATTSTLTGAARTQLDQEVQTEIDQIEDDIKFFKYWPMVGLGLRFRLN